MTLGKCINSTDMISDEHYLQNVIGNELMLIPYEDRFYCFLTDDLYYYVYETYELPEERQNPLYIKNMNNPYTNIPFTMNVFTELTDKYRRLKQTKNIHSYVSDKNLTYEMNGIQFSEDELLETIKQLEDDTDYLEYAEILLEDMPDELTKTHAIVEYIQTYIH